jgi:hypothetical protein
VGEGSAPPRLSLPVRRTTARSHPCEAAPGGAVGLPAFNAVQRHAELEADRFALELTHENRGEALLQAHYSKYKLNEYYGFYRVWRANHPSQAERVRLANTYHPWDNGGALVYGHVCRMP